MGKAMSIAGMVIGGLLALMFVADAFLGIPLGGEAPMFVDLGFAACGGILAYLGFNAFRESP